MMPNNSRLHQMKQALLLHYSAPLAVTFRQFRNGAIYFAVGLATVLFANAYMPPSVQQEWLVLGGLVLGGYGFVLAMMAQMRLMISRLVQFFRDDH